MLERILEPEAMDTFAEAEEYDAMDHRDVNERFASDFLLFADSAGNSPQSIHNILDVGAGTAQIPIHLVQIRGSLRITAIDLAESMLSVARRNIAAAGLGASIKLIGLDAKAMTFADGAFDAVISNSIIHHIPAPISVFCEMRRVLRPGGLLFVRDLLRPKDLPQLNKLVDRYAAGASTHQRRMFADSLHAALSLEEVRALITAQGIPEDCVAATSDRHWTLAAILP